MGQDQDLFIYLFIIYKINDVQTLVQTISLPYYKRWD